MSRLAAFFGALAALAVIMAPAPARAETADKLTNLTFNRPVQVPGAMLDAGTYRFRLANPDSSRNIIQVLSHDGSYVYAMFYTMPDFRVEATDDPVMTFKETPAGVPPIAKSLFYSGELSGYEFLWYGEKPVTTATVPPQPPITYTRMPAVAEPVAEPEPAVEPAPAPAAEPAPVVTPAPTPFEPAVTGEGEAAAAAEELPKTASLLPLAALGGFSSLALGLGAALVRRRFV